MKNEILLKSISLNNTANSNYKPYQDFDIEKEIYSMNGEGKFHKGLKSASRFLNTHPLSVQILFEKAFSSYKLGQNDSADYYLYQEHRIYQAMRFSGDGKTPETPMFALGSIDGQGYIYKYIGANIGTMGSGRDKYGNFLDILEATFDDGKSMNLYFIIQHATDKMFDGRSIGEQLNSKIKMNKTAF